MLKWCYIIVMLDVISEEILSLENSLSPQVIGDIAPQPQVSNENSPQPQMIGEQESSSLENGIETNSSTVTVTYENVIQPNSEIDYVGLSPNREILPPSVYCKIIKPGRINSSTQAVRKAPKKSNMKVVRKWNERLQLLCSKFIFFAYLTGKNSRSSDIVDAYNCSLERERKIFVYHNSLTNWRFLGQ